MSIAMAHGMRKRMAAGGFVADEKKSGYQDMPCEEHGEAACEMCHGGKMAEGGFVEDEKESGYLDMPPDSDKPNAAAMEETEHGQRGINDDDLDLVGRIMARMYSEGGRVANDTPPIADSEPADYDDLANRDDLESSYTGANSGDEIGDKQEDEDREDVASRAYRSWKKKDRNPSPA